MFASWARASPGLSIAYELSHAGQKVIVLDDGAIGRGMTARTTAHLVNALDDRYYDLEKYHGEDGARMAAQSHSAAIDRVEKIVDTEKIDCDFERLDGYLFEPPNESLKNLEKEFDACLRAGLAVEWVKNAPIEGLRNAPRHSLSAPGADSSAEISARSGGSSDSPRRTDFHGHKGGRSVWVGRTRASRPRIN